jgi:hypothetical protein
MPTTITSAGITFNDTTSLTSAVIPANAVGATQIANGSVTAEKLGTNEQKQICKAWVNFDGYTVPGTIRSSYNVSSVTKNATGNYTINFTSAMSDTNYAVLGTTMNIAAMTVQVDSINWYSTPTTKTTSAVRVNCGTPSINYDCAQVYVAIFGN